MTGLVDQLRALTQPRSAADELRALLQSGYSQPQADAQGRPVAMQPPRVEVQEAQAADMALPAPPPERWAFPQIPGEGPVVDAVNTYLIGNSETAGDGSRALLSGIVRGGQALGDMPGQLADAGMRAVGRGAEAVTNAVMGENAPAWSGEIPSIMASANAFAPGGPGTFDRGLREVPGGGAALDFEPETTAGEYAQTVGEFLPGAALFGGGGASTRAVVENLLRYGVAPGLASEAAGQATEGTAAEPWARAGAAIGTSILTGRPSGNARPVVPRADPEDARMAETLMRNGVRPTVGQVTRSSALRRMEGTVGEVAGQGEDLTAAAMRTTGSTANRATPQALAQAADDIGRQMDDAVRGVDVPGSPQLAQQADDIVANYLEYSAANDVLPAVGNIAERIRSAANGSTIPASTLNQWRSNIRQLLSSNHGPTREAAFALRNLLDDAVISQLNAAGRADDVAALMAGREQYRNWLAVADASTRATAENGILSPTQLNQAVIRTQGRRNMAVGNTTPLGDLSRSAAGVLRPEATTQAGGVRSFSDQVFGGGLGGAAGASLMPQDPIAGMVLGGIAGAQGVNTLQAGMRSRAVQNLLMDPRNQIVRALIASGPGAANQ